MRVAITGATGLIGRALTTSLWADGHTVVRLVRRPPRRSEIPRLEEAEWRAEQGRIDAVALSGTDAVVHLAGEPLGRGLWTRRRRALIRRSRVHGTRALCRALVAMDRPPTRLLSASGTHVYGETGDTVATEETPPGTGFLADVCREWEAATLPAEEAGMSVAHLRTGVVLAREGGMLRSLLPLYRWGFGGRLGSGAQYLTWFSLVDQVGAIRFLLERPDLTGPVNLCAPEPVSNAAFVQALERVLGRPTILPIPSTAIRVTLGDFTEESALIDLRARPERLEKAGYSFLLPDVDSALSDILARPGPSVGA
ncbi:TIGR01777 family oxidoreductase [Nocardiopsis sp. MG754419]|uniref:TIGR01777 family oxidoreductase n=1 Tax=Nocardiopsis sp. MG754419 TaxID=2259865 RepID=UPI001BADECFE|nr:TIGR01777 family oxidoreductase [Nocardiopsis sp. MG754419]MBR8744413.1 TIGR01777 family protein [Nocardiopsis sp. MG754419]